MTSGHTQLSSAMELLAQSRWTPETTWGVGGCPTENTLAPWDNTRLEKLPWAGGMQGKDRSGPSHPIPQGRMPGAGCAWSRLH